MSLMPVTATWSSSTPAVATVDKNGLVTAGADGSTIITANSGAESGNATVTVGAMMTASAPPAADRR
jgi:uncharacterized protein YjdB